MRVNGKNPIRHMDVISPSTVAVYVAPILPRSKDDNAKSKAWTTRNILSIGVGRMILETYTMTPKKVANAILLVLDE